MGLTRKQIEFQYRCGHLIGLEAVDHVLEFRDLVVIALEQLQREDLKHEDRLSRAKLLLSEFISAMDEPIISMRGALRAIKDERELPWGFRYHETDESNSH